jgi:transposase, IS5 family
MPDAMLGKTEKNPQLNLAQIPLIHTINPGHDLCRLVRQTDWERVEKEFAAFYSQKGAPSVPIRIIVGISLLKQVYKQSDKSALMHWVENPYWQYFCGEVYFQHKVPFYYSDLSHFRKRIGKDGEKKILDLGREIFGPSFGKSIPGHTGHSKTKKFLFSGILYKFGHYLVQLSSD